MKLYIHTAEAFWRFFYQKYEVRIWISYWIFKDGIWYNNGKHFTILLPNVNTDCMNVYLKELSKEIKGDFILIMDGAGWHKSKNLIIPKNIQIILLPPYCPELNLVERLWRYIKDNTIKNKVFETLTELENLVCKFVRNLGNEIIKNTCFVNDQLESWNGIRSNWWKWYLVS